MNDVDQIRKKLRSAASASALLRKRHKGDAVKKSFTRKPTVYIPEGTLEARFYVDSDGQHLRIIYQHGSGRDAIRCYLVGECEVCRHIRTMEGKYPRLPQDGLWQFKSREVAMAYAYLFNYEGPRPKYVKVLTPVLLVGDYRLRAALDRELSAMEDSDLRQVFTPWEAHAIWEITRDKKQFSCKPTAKRGKVPSLPPDFPPLRSCLQKEDEYPSRIQVSDLIGRITAYCERWSCTLEPNEIDKGTDMEASNPVCHSQENNEVGRQPCWGHHWEISITDCIMCLEEEDCIKASSGQTGTDVAGEAPRRNL